MTRYCPTHGPVLPLRGIPAGALIGHLFLTLMSCGLWTPLWLLHVVAAAAVPRCPTCGQATTAKATP